MKGQIRIYKHGIHYGEEQLIHGNDRSGVIYFSGCNLRCSFCYCKEISYQNQGNDYNSTEFITILNNLLSRGAKNINLVSPTFQWEQIYGPLKKFIANCSTPIIINISGYEDSKTIEEMLQIGDIFVPDFKVYKQTAAISVNLPKDYAKRAINVIKLIQANKSDKFVSKKMTQGMIIRHLLIPGLETDSLDIIEELNTTGVQSYLNIMDKFLDTNNSRIIRAPNEVLNIIQHSYTNLLISGKGVECVKKAV